MDSQHPDQKLIEKRQAEYEAAWQNQSIERVMSFMADDVSVSDFGSSSFFSTLSSLEWCPHSSTNNPTLLTK